MRFGLTKDMGKKSVYLLIAIILVSVFFRTWNMTSFDVSGDHALNSLRSLGWLDYIPGEGQTGPIQWFETRPSWAAWSFQDAPPLVFIIQHISFLFFGDNTFAARLPFVLAGILTTLIIFLLLKKYTDQRSALIGSALFAISSYAVWASLTGYLEGVLVFFLALSLFFALPWVTVGGGKKKYLWPLFAAFSLMSKYTALFILPAAAVSFLVYWRGRVFNKKILKHLAVSFVIFVVILLPLINYNIHVYKARGHFDSSLSSLVGISSPDFSILGDRHATLDIVGNVTSMKSVLLGSNSLPYLFLFIFSVIWLVVRFFMRRNSLFENVLLLHVIFLITMLAFSSSNAVRILSVFSLFMATTSAIFVVSFHRFLVSRNKILSHIFFVLFAIIFIAETLFSLNTNVLSKPIGFKPDRASSFLYSPSRIYDNGWNDMERYVEKNIILKRNPIVTATRSEDITRIDDEIYFKGQNVLLYDERLNWFNLSWYSYKYLIYYKFPLFKASVLGEGLGGKSFISQVDSIGAKHIYFIYGMDDVVLDTVKKHGPVAESTKAYKEVLDKEKVPFEEIKGADGGVTFRIYKMR